MVKANAVKWWRERVNNRVSHCAGAGWVVRGNVVNTGAFKGFVNVAAAVKRAVICRRVGKVLKIPVRLCPGPASGC